MLNEHTKFLCKKGQVLHIAGEADRAAEALAQAQAIAGELNAEPESEVGQALEELAAVLGVELESAEESGEAVEEDEERELAILEGERLFERGEIERGHSRYEESKTLYTEALRLFRNQGYRTGEANAMAGLGSLYFQLGDYPNAIEQYTQSLTIVRETGDMQSEGGNLGNLGMVYEALGDYLNAIEHYTQAVIIAGEIGNKRSEGINLGNLGNAYRALGDYPNAIEHFTQAVTIAREIGERLRMRSHRESRAHLSKPGRLPESHRVHQRSYQTRARDWQ